MPDDRAARPNTVPSARFARVSALNWPALLLAALPIGHSVAGRPIWPVELGSPSAVHRVLVVGCIHGNETAGIAIVQRLIATGAPRGTEIVAVTSVNPDGCARGTRQNADGVDLNRNFPSNWARIGRRGSFQWSGPRPLSEPESRYRGTAAGRRPH